MILRGIVRIRFFKYVDIKMNPTKIRKKLNSKKYKCASINNIFISEI